MRTLAFIACLVGFVMGAWKLWNEREQSQPPGILVDEEPLQSALAFPLEFSRHDYRMVGRAEFHINARVILRSRYQYDAHAKLMPVDLALGWGEMSDTAVLERLSCNQGSRFYYCSWQSADVIHPDTFRRSSANMHMIPASDAVEEALLRVRKGQIVSIRGYLVDVEAPGGQVLRTSLTRDDNGPGGCEIIWVTEVSAS